MYAICWEIKCQGRCITSISSTVPKWLHYTAVKQLPHTHNTSQGFILRCQIFVSKACSTVIKWKRRTVPTRYHKGFILTLQPPSQSKLVWLYSEADALPSSLFYIYSDTPVNTLEDRFPFASGFNPQLTSEGFKSKSNNTYLHKYSAIFLSEMSLTIHFFKWEI